MDSTEIKDRKSRSDLGKDRVARWNKFLAELDPEEQRVYCKMQSDMVLGVKARQTGIAKVPFSLDAAAEVIMSIVEYVDKEIKIRMKGELDGK